MAMEQLTLTGVPPAPPPPPPVRKAKGVAYRVSPPTTRVTPKAKPKRTTPTPTHFDGQTYDHARDGVRLAAQMVRVLHAMQDGQWHTLGELSSITMDPTPSISARLRDLRKPRFGAFTIMREHISNGLHRYRLAPHPTHGGGAPAGGEC